ncbi:unnamed protein product [Periconia digitata]|uniref:TauD/TfdA-like domain-containing protein n=1 Tax=Periconia digitata TaxID=1303443 RepID=A0A9W4XNI2_9PLEO|nr:unnamed protein product [Periconia digitata]
MAKSKPAKTGPVGQPDIGYTPDYKKYLARKQRRLETETLEKELPSGFPKRLESNLVWDNIDIASRYDWTLQLSPDDLQELQTALRHFQGLGKPPGYVSQETFPLDKLHSKLREVSTEIHDGFGFKVVRGLPIDKYTREEALVVYAGLASHVAPTRGRQDHKWDGKPADVAVNHIKDMTAKVDTSKIGAPAYTTDKQVFHTDSGDIIALLCLETAAEGGLSKLSSSWRVYNELAETRPDLIKTLAEPWPVENFDGQGQPYINRPLLFYQAASNDISANKERLIIQYARRTFTGFLGLPRSASIPPITEAQAEALDTLHFLAEKHALSLDFQKGDIQFVNNLSIFHARDGFVDSEVKQRHLVRLWLRDDEFAWKIPEELGARWDKVYKGVTPENQIFPLEPFVRSASLGKVESGE